MTDIPPHSFTFIEDPGHGWLEVPRTLIAALRLMDKITPYSYQNGDRVYLEEDSDFPAFWGAYETRYGVPLEYETRHVNHFIGRTAYARFTPDQRGG